MLVFLGHEAPFSADTGAGEVAAECFAAAVVRVLTVGLAVDTGVVARADAPLCAASDLAVRAAQLGAALAFVQLVPVTTSVSRTVFKKKQESRLFELFVQELLVIGGGCPHRVPWASGVEWHCARLVAC